MGVGPLPLRRQRKEAVNAATFAAFLAVSTPAAKPLTLPEAYAVALRRSERLAQDREALAEVNARIDEIWSAVKPRISFFAIEQVQDTPAAAAGIASSFSQRYRPQAGFSAHQPLFSGFREFLAAKSAKARGDSARHDVRRAEQSLYADVATHYLALLSIQKEIATRLEIAELTADRIKELRQRERVGRSRKSEVLAAESQLSQVESDAASARGRYRVAQFNLRFVTGLETDLLPLDVAVATPAALSDYLARAEARADVSARGRDVDSALLDVAVFSRQRWPTLAADGNYYVKRPDGFQRDIRWDATLSLSLPLYSGGAFNAQTEQARARSRAADLAFSLAKRRAGTEVRSAYDNLQSSLAIVAALERALDLARKNAIAQAADYRLGLVTNLDVLNALNTVQTTRLALENALLAAALADSELEVASGGPEPPNP